MAPPRIRPSFAHIEEVNTRHIIDLLAEVGIVKRLGYSDKGLFGSVWEFDDDLYREGVDQHIMCWCNPQTYPGRKVWESFDDVTVLVAKHFKVSVESLRTTIKGKKGWKRDCLVQAIQEHAYGGEEEIMKYIGWEKVSSVRAAIRRVRRQMNGGYCDKLWEVRMLRTYLAIRAPR